MFPYLDFAFVFGKLLVMHCSSFKFKAGFPTLPGMSGYVQTVLQMQAVKTFRVDLQCSRETLFTIYDKSSFSMSRGGIEAICWHKETVQLEIMLFLNSALGLLAPM